MKTKIIGENMLAQCPLCMTIKMETNNKKHRIVYQKSIVEFTHLPKEQCIACQQK